MNSFLDLLSDGLGLFFVDKRDRAILVLIKKLFLF